MKVQSVSGKQIKNLSTQKNKVLNIDELNAYKVAYGKPLGKKDYIVYIGMPAILFALFSFLLLYYWWLALIFGVFGAIYGAKTFLPKSIQKQYEIRSFSQRNKFVNNMTQILTDENKTVTKALQVANSRSEGEFQQDITRLQARLMGADNEKIRKSFKLLAEKYKSDIIFTQYLEQLETSMLEGRANIDTLKDVKTYHNDMKKKQNEYEAKKQGHLKDMKMLLGVVLIFILSITFSFGFDTYINAFARHPIGWETVSIYTALMASFFKKFSTYLFDDSVLEVKM